MTGYLTTQQVADHYNSKNPLLELDTRQVLYALRRKYLVAEKVGWQWLFPANRLPEKWPVREKQRKTA